MSGFACHVGLNGGPGAGDPEPLAGHALGSLRAVILRNPLAEGLA